MIIKRKQKSELTIDGERLLNYCYDILQGDCKYHITRFDEDYFEPLKENYSREDVAYYMIILLSQYERKDDK